MTAKHITHFIVSDMRVSKSAWNEIQMVAASTVFDIFLLLRKRGWSP